MRRQGHLFAQVVDFGALCEAARRTLRGRRSRPCYARLAYDLESEVLALQRELLDGSYKPRGYRTFSIDGRKSRAISAAALRDRIVQHSLCAALEPVFEGSSIFDSYACRVGKGTHKALARARQFARTSRYFLKLDVRRCFETIDHEVLKAQLRRVVKDTRVLRLSDLMIDHGAPGSAFGKGLPIGNLTSQHFANHYLGALDHFVKEELRVHGYLRYMDDEVLLGDSKNDLWAAHDGVQSFVRKRLRLELKDEATVLAPVSEGIPFLGYRIWPGATRLDRTSRQRFIEGVRRLEQNLDDQVIAEEEFVRSMASRVGHLIHADTTAFRRSVFFTEAGGHGRRQARTG